MVDEAAGGDEEGVSYQPDNSEVSRRTAMS